MPVCTEELYHRAKFQVAQKMISMTGLDDMHTKERNQVRNITSQKAKSGKQFKLLHIFTAIIYRVCNITIVFISDKSGNETTSDSDGQ